MGIIYSPLLCITAFLEVRQAKKVVSNRRKGEEDEDITEEWEQLDWSPEEEDEAWVHKVERTRPNVEVDGTTVEVRELKGMVEGLKEHVGMEELRAEIRELRALVEKMANTSAGTMQK